MREILFRGFSNENDVFIKGSLLCLNDKAYINPWGYEEMDGIEWHKSFHEVDMKTIGQFTGYEMLKEKVFFGDLVSNNYGTNKEVVREIVEHNGNKMMKRVKGNSRLPKYIPLHEWHALNFRVIGNIYDK